MPTIQLLKYMYTVKTDMRQFSMSLIQQTESMQCKTIKQIHGLKKG